MIKINNTVTTRTLFVMLLLVFSFSCIKQKAIYEVLSPCAVNSKSNHPFTPCIKRTPLLNRDIV